MDQGTLIFGLVTLILGAGGVGSLIPLFRYRADRNNVIAVGSEAAVQSLTIALERADKRVTHLEEENHKLRANVNNLRANVENLMQDLAEMKTKYERMLRNKGE